MYTEPSKDIFFFVKKDDGVFFISKAHLMKLDLPALS